MSPVWIVTGGSVSAVSGPRLGTVTANTCVAASPSVSTAVIVTVASPCATAFTVAEPPDVDTVTTAASDVAAEYTSESPSGSMK